MTDPNEVIGRIPAVAILQDQPVTENMLASAQAGDEFDPHDAPVLPGLGGRFSIPLG